MLIIGGIVVFANLKQIWLILFVIENDWIEGCGRPNIILCFILRIVAEVHNLWLHFCVITHRDRCEMNHLDEACHE